MALVGVTGATGMIGRYLMRELRARGHQPIGIARSPDKAPSLPKQGYDMRKADLADPAALRLAFEGLDAVVSNAAVIALGGQSPKQVLANNVDGTKNVFDAMAHAGVKRAVLTSSGTVYRAARDVITEEHPCRSLKDFTHRLNCYAISKAAAEDVARDVSAKHGIALSIARPYQVYGAFDYNGFTKYLRMLMWPPISVWMTHWYYPSVYAGDLADAMVRMLEVDAAKNEAFNVCGDIGTDSYWAHMKAWKQAGLRTPKLVIPFPMPLRRAFSNEKAKRILGWKPRPLLDGFIDLAQFEASARLAPAQLHMHRA